MLDYKPNSKKIMKIKESCELTGIGKNTTYELVKRKDFPSLQVGRKYYILRDKVMDWFENHIGEKI